MKQNKGFITVLMMVLISISLSTFSRAAFDTFSDVPNDSPFHESIFYLAERGIVCGEGNGRYVPDAPVTVRQWATMLCRALGDAAPLNYDDDCIRQGYSDGWLEMTAITAPDSDLCRYAIYKSGFAAFGVDLYSLQLYPNEGKLSQQSEVLRAAADFGLCEETCDGTEIITRGEAAELLYALLTKTFAVVPPPMLDIVSLGGIYYAAHYVCSGIGRMAVNDELAAFHNHTNFGKNTQRAFLFAGSSYESVIEELKTQDEKRNEKLIRYGEAYHCLHAPIHLLSCDETGAQQLQIMTVPDYRVKLTRLMLRSAYQPPPEDIAAWDGLYNGHPFVVGADMDLRRIDTAVRTAKQHGCLPIALAALEGQGSAVLLQRYADPGCATVYKVTENVLSELLGRAPNLYVPPRTQFLTEKGDVVDAPLIKTPGKAGGPHRK